MQAFGVIAITDEPRTRRGSSGHDARQVMRIFDGLQRESRRNGRRKGSRKGTRETMKGVTAQAAVDPQPPDGPGRLKRCSTTSVPQCVPADSLVSVKPNDSYRWRAESRPLNVHR